MAFLFLVACSSSNHKDLEPRELLDFNKALEIDQLWKKSVGPVGEFYHQFRLAVDASYLYSASASGNVYQMDKLSGDTRWKVSLDTQLTAGIAIDNQHAYVGSLDGALIALSKSTGQQIWSAMLPSEMVSAPAVNGDSVVVQLSNGQIHKLNAQTGDSEWVYDGYVPALTIRGTGRAVFFGQFVAIGLANGKLAILDVDSGQLRWENKVGIAKGDTEIERMVDVDTEPAMVRDKLFSVSYQGRIVAYDLQTGRTVWTEDESSYRDLTTGFGNVYASSDEGVITAYEQQTGNVKWSNEDLLRRKISSATTVSSYLVVTDFDGYLHVISQVDGELVARDRVDVLARKCFCRGQRLSNVWRLINDSSGVRASVLADGDRFYALANNGKLKAYQLAGAIENANNIVTQPRHWSKTSIKKRSAL